jgi:hypothetical protein
MTPAGRIRLKAVKAGSRWLIKEADFDEFMARLTSASCPETSQCQPPASPKQRSCSIAAASKKLDEMLEPRRGK